MSVAAQEVLDRTLRARWQVAAEGGAGTLRAMVIADVLNALPPTAPRLPEEHVPSVLGQLVKRLLAESPITTKMPQKKAWPLVRAQQQQKWPPALHDFARRAFEQAQQGDDAQRAAVEQQLHVLINQAIARGVLYTTDWANEPLPTAPTKRKIECVQHLTLNPPSAAHPSASIGACWLRPRRDVESRAEETPQMRLQKRAERFHDSLASTTTATATGRGRGRGVRGGAGLRVMLGNPFRGSRAMQPVRGTSQELEKPYLRLTAAPDPRSVRPEPVLRRALQLVLSKLANGGEYSAAVEQFKSIRQDLTVQHIRGAFAVEVYESHGREALAQGDFNEFNQCQSQLFLLYREEECQNMHEFAVYRLLYLTLIAKTDGLVSAIEDLAADGSLLASQMIKLAMELSRAARTRNYTGFFAAARLITRCSGLARPSVQTLVNELALKIRDAALRAIVTAYRPSVDISLVQHALGFSSLADCRAFLRSYSLSFTDAKCHDIDTKTSVLSLSRSPPPQTVTPVIF